MTDETIRSALGPEEADRQVQKAVEHGKQLLGQLGGGSSVEDQVAAELAQMDNFRDAPPPPPPPSQACEHGVPYEQGPCVECNPPPNNGQAAAAMKPTFADRLIVGDAIENLPPPEYLVENYLVRNSLAMIYGPSGHGKSFLSIGLALHVATGLPWNGHQVRQGSVLYVAAEGVAGAGKRQAAWKKHMHIDTLKDAEPIWWYPRAVNLLDRPTILEIGMFAQEHKPAMTVFDTQARCTPGGDELGGRDMGVLVDHVDQIRQASGTCAVLIHHAGKDLSAGSRGWSGVKGALDTELEITAVDTRHTLKVTKQKDDAEAPPLALDRVVIDLPPLADGTPQNSCVLIPSGLIVPTDNISGRELITLDALRAVQVPGGVTDSVWREAAIEAGIPRTTYYNHRSHLIARKMVQVGGTDARHRYTPTPLDQTGTEGDD